jgi:diguanylate cyclase (GGDEF)-like protein
MDPVPHSSSPDAPTDLRLARHVADLETRIGLLHGVAWDVNLLALSAHDALVLSTSSRQEGFPGAADRLGELSESLAVLLEQRTAPDEETRSRLGRLAGEARAALPALQIEDAGSDIDALFDLDVSEALPIGGNMAEYDGFETESARSLSDLALVEDDSSAMAFTAAEPIPTRAPAPPAIELPEAPDWSIATDHAQSSDLLAAGARAAAATAASTPDPIVRSGPRTAPSTPSWLAEELLAQGAAKPAGPRIPAAASVAGEQRMAYLLAGDSAFAGALEKALVDARFEVHRFDDPAELAETVGALLPAVVLTAPDAFNGLETVASAVVRARKRANAPILLLTIAADGSIPARLAAMRGGADAFLVEPIEPSQVVSRIGELESAGAGEPFRVLIVEDDRPQAVFAESILRKAGMQTRAVHDPLEALDALEQFDPELILMDLLMPGCDGIELTTLIRERERHVDVPIVFLSGEQNAERRYDALAVGGDDFLEKPIKPKFLLSAVTNRVRRARALRQRGAGHGPRPAERTAALYDRTRLIDRIGEALNGAGPTTPGGLLFLIVDGAQALRDRLGLMAFDLAMQQAGAMLAESLPAGDLAARFGDSSFVVLAATAPRDQLAGIASRLSRAFAERLIESEAGSLSLAASIGIAGFAQGWRDAGAAVNGAERAATKARTLAGERIVFSSGPEQGAASDVDAALRNATVAAMEGGGLSLLYQPIASLQGRTDEIFQVLLRIRDERGRRYSAAEIVPTAERCGLIDQLDRAVLARCVEVLGLRVARGRRTALIVSQSIHALRDAARIEWLKGEALAHGVEPSQLLLELRHDDVAPRLAEAAAWFDVARQGGFRTAIGAFEPNPASVQSLARLPIDALRVNGRFVAQLDADRSRMLAELVDAAHARGALVVAPMVEDARTAAALWNTGVDLIQGDFVQSAGPDLEFDFRAATL